MVKFKFMLLKDATLYEGMPSHWVSEKMDGMRCYYDGEKFWSRLGNEIMALPEWRENLDRRLRQEFGRIVQLDMELYCYDSHRQDLMSIVKRKNPDFRWLSVVPRVFEFPNWTEIFDNKVKNLNSLNKRLSDNHFEQRLMNFQEMTTFLEEVFSRGGEGIVLRVPKTFYENKRSNLLLRVKDKMFATSKIVTIIPGEGKHASRIGAINLEDGACCGTGRGSDWREILKVGDVVEYQYMGKSKAGVPYHCSFLRKLN